MSREEIYERIEQIKLFNGDDERQHLEEDLLRFDFIYAISIGEYSDFDELKELSEIVLSTDKLDFSRWYA